MMGPGNVRPDRKLKSSATWSSSSGDLALVSDSDEIEDRTGFVREYNKLAKKHGVRVMPVGDSRKEKNSTSATSQKRHWWSRVLRGASGRHQDHHDHHDHHHDQTSSQPRLVRHRRSVSDLAMHLVQYRKDQSKTLTLQDMVRLSGKSLLYLPAEYSPGALILPTCLRATAQYLVHQGAISRGIFRVPGSVRVVNALFDYYCSEQNDEAVTRTIRCPTLPLHIKAGPHDVGSAFKKFLGTLPGGILGSLTLFDAFVAVHSQLNGEPEFNRTRQTKLRARLIALAIGTVDSQFRRELICAVLGLLSLIGRHAETTPHEDGRGHPLPTSDLMGYSALGVVFGPLLVGDLIDCYTMKVAQPPSGLSLFPLTPPQTRRERARRTDRSSTSAPDGSQSMDKVLLANEIAQMVVTHWREVVRQLKYFSILRSQDGASWEDADGRGILRSSKTDAFDIAQDDASSSQQYPDHEGIRKGPHIPESPTLASWRGILKGPRSQNVLTDTLSVPKRRPKASQSEPSSRILVRPSRTHLSPTAEESIRSTGTPQHPASKPHNVPVEASMSGYDKTPVVESTGNWPQKRHNRPLHSSQLGHNVAVDEGPDELGYQRSSSNEPSAPTQAVRSFRILERSDKPTSQRDAGGDYHKDESVVRSRRADADNRPVSRSSNNSESSGREYLQPNDAPGNRKDSGDENLSGDALYTEDSQKYGPSTPRKRMIERRDSIQKTPKEMHRRVTSTSKDETQPVFKNTDDHHFPEDPVTLQTGVTSSTGNIETTVAAPLDVSDYGESGGPGSSQAQLTASNSFPSDHGQVVERPGSVRSGSVASVASEVAVVAQRNRASRRQDVTTQVKQASTTQLSASGTMPREPGSVKALAEMWEGQSTESPAAPSPGPATIRRSDCKTEGIASPYRARSQKSLPGHGRSKERQEVADGVTQSGPVLKKPLRMSVSDNTTLRQTEDPAPGLSPLKQGYKIQDVQLKPVALSEKEEKTPDTGCRQQEFDDGLERPLSLGVMGPHEEQPPVDKHISFARPPGAVPMTVPTTDKQGFVSTQGGGASVLHAQIRNMQRQLDARAEEVSSLRRQLETHESLDIGVLSQQLREAKRASSIWKARAISAEKRVAVFKRFTVRLRSLWAKRVRANRRQAAEDKAQAQEEADAVFREEEEIVNMEMGEEEPKAYGGDGSADVGGTEDADALTGRTQRQSPGVLVGNGGTDTTGERPRSSEGDTGGGLNRGVSGGPDDTMFWSPRREQEPDEVGRGTSLEEEDSASEAEIRRVIEDMLAFCGNDAANALISLEGDGK